MRKNRFTVYSKCIFFALAFIAGLAATSYSQISINNTFMPKANIVKKNPPQGESAKLGINILDLEFGFPMYAKGDASGFTEVTGTIGFRQQSFSLELPQADTDFFPKNLYALNYSMALIKSLGSKWYMVNFGSLGFYSDFENVDGDHLLVEGGAFFVRKFSKSFDFGLGPVFTYAFGEPLIIPAPFVRYNSGGKVSVEVKFPRYITVGYAFSQGFQSRLAIRSLYNNYAIGDSRAEVNGESPVIVFSDITLGIESSLVLFKPVALTFGVGTTVDREFVVNDDAGDELFDRGMQDTFFFNLGLSAEF